MQRLLKATLATLSLLTATAIIGCNGASERAREMVGKDGEKGFMMKTLVRGDHVRKYGLFIPLSYKPTTKYPVIIFLHGVGEGAGMGEGDGKNLTVGLGPFVGLQRDSFPFICIFPQSAGSWDANSEYAADVIQALDDVTKAYSVDADRVSLTGLSTGGYGTYAIGAKYADRFAALVPMGSNGNDLAEADKLTHVAVRAYCSASGDIFAGSNDRDMVEKIKMLGGNAQFIETPTSGHDCWDYVYGSGELFAWMQQQHRQTKRSATPAKTSMVTPAPTAPVAAAHANTAAVVSAN